AATAAGNRGARAHAWEPRQRVPSATAAPQLAFIKQHMWSTGMARTSNASRQTALLLTTLLENPAAWSHGYRISQLTGLKSGTLYPLLIRLEEQGFLESKWQETDRPGGPPRHVYRLTQSGRAFARERKLQRFGGIARRLGRAT